MWNEKFAKKSLKKFAILLLKFHKVVMIGQASCRVLSVCLKRRKTRRALLVRTFFNKITTTLPLFSTDATYWLCSCKNCNACITEKRERRKNVVSQYATKHVIWSMKRLLRTRLACYLLHKSNNYRLYMYNNIYQINNFTSYYIFFRRKCNLYLL